MVIGEYWHFANGKKIHLLNVMIELQQMILLIKHAQRWQMVDIIGKMNLVLHVPKIMKIVLIPRFN